MQTTPQNKTTTFEAFQSVQWLGDKLVIIDQTKLPQKEIYIELRTVGQVWEAIKKLRVRGAPALGIVGAYGFCLGMKSGVENDIEKFTEHCRSVSDYLNSSRPTAVNLSWSLKQLMNMVETHKARDIVQLKNDLLNKAINIHNEDRELCKAIGENGKELFGDSTRVLTHCNTGGLATGQYGTALSCITHAHETGKIKKVWVDETRPLLQGARLTTWELQKANVPHSLIVDSAAGFLMSRGEVDLVIVGADRITRNGDTANKIGTYPLSVLAKEHGIPFYVAAPYSTIDMELENGDQIEIELREESEVTGFNKDRSSPEGTRAFNPAFDITPNKNITAIITEKGIIYPEYEKNFVSEFGKAKV